MIITPWLMQHGCCKCRQEFREVERIRVIETGTLGRVGGIGLFKDMMTIRSVIKTLEHVDCIGAAMVALSRTVDCTCGGAVDGLHGKSCKRRIAAESLVIKS